MKTYSLYSPCEASIENFDIGLLLPSFKEGVLPFVTLMHWLNAVSQLEKKYKVLILLLVNGPSSNLTQNRETLYFGRKLIHLLEHGEDDPSISHDASLDSLYDNLQLFIYKNSERVKIVIGEYYHPKHTIGNIRHIGCSYLKEQMTPSGIIISTDSDTRPSESGYLLHAIEIFEQDKGLGGITGDFSTFLNVDCSDRTLQLYKYESICQKLYFTMIARSMELDRWDDIGNLAVMSGCNTLFRAHLYDDAIRFSDNLGTGEDMDFSRRLLEANHRIIYDKSVQVSTLYRPSDRTEYGLGTEIERVNQSQNFSVEHPLVRLSHISIRLIFDHIAESTSIGIQDKTQALIACLQDEFDKEVINESIVEKLRTELNSSKGLLIGRPNLNDKALRIVIDRLREYYQKIDIKEAYEWIIRYLQEGVHQLGNSHLGIFLHLLFQEELIKFQRYDANISNYEVFLGIIIDKIDTILSSINTQHYQNNAIRLEPENPKEE